MVAQTILRGTDWRLNGRCEFIVQDQSGPNVFPDILERDPRSVALEPESPILADLLFCERRAWCGGKLPCGQNAQDRGPDRSFEKIAHWLQRPRVTVHR